MPPKRKRPPTGSGKSLKAKVLKKDIDSMIQDIRVQEKEGGEIVKLVISKLKSGADVKYSEVRRRFVDVDALCSEEDFANIVQKMVSNYIVLLQQYSKGKRFGMFEQAWLMKIEEFFTAPVPIDSDSCYSTLKLVTEKCKYEASVHEHRIVISTIAYIVYDIMTEKVKYFKSHLATETSSHELLVESNVSLYRYGGFALHLLCEKYKGDSSKENTMSVLKKLMIKHDQLPFVPYAVQQLNQGGLVTMDSCMLPYLRALLEMVSSLVNEDQSHEYGQHMIAI